jgi:hypothetical protein
MHTESTVSTSTLQTDEHSEANDIHEYWLVTDNRSNSIPYRSPLRIGIGAVITYFILEVLAFHQLL